MARKLLLVVFTNDACRRNHAFMYAIECAQHGHTVRLILDGEAVQCLRAREGRFATLFDEAAALGLLEGVCKTAAGGCGDASRDLGALAQNSGLPLLDSMRGHGGVARFVDEGYEVVVF
jgi:hypothetical protein